MSIAMFIRMTLCAMAGLAAVRRCRAHQVRCRLSSHGLGRPPSHHSPVAHARSIPQSHPQAAEPRGRTGSQAQSHGGPRTRT